MVWGLRARLLPTSCISFILQVNSLQGDWLIHATFAGSFTFSLTSPGTLQVFSLCQSLGGKARLGWFVFNLVVWRVTVHTVQIYFTHPTYLFLFIWFIYLSFFSFFLSFSSAVICHPGAFVCHLAVTWRPAMLDWHGSLPTVTELRSSCPKSLGWFSPAVTHYTRRETNKSDADYWSYK